MVVYNVEKTFGWAGKVTAKSAAVMKMFGVDLDRLSSNATCHKCTVDIRPGDICYITGASGSGKSVLLRELYAAADKDERVDLDEIVLPDDETVVDGVKGDFYQGLRTLSTAGLSDVFCVLNRPSVLSEGQKYRFRLATALASGKRMIFADEFCSSLDRITAAVIAYNIQKFAQRYGVSFILASSHDDILCDLSPDIVIVKYLAGEARVIYRENTRGSV